MCVIIDPCSMSRVFDKSNAEHFRFAPVNRWVLAGNGSVVYGGTKYERELHAVGKFLPLFTELERKGRALRVDKRSVDEAAAEIKRKVPDKKFNDEHLVAIAGIAGCCLICTDEKEALPYFRRRDLYPAGVAVPNVYRNLCDQRYCCNRSLVGICESGKRNSRYASVRKPRPKVVAD